MVPRKEVAHTTKIHAGHVGTTEDDVATGSLLGFFNNQLKPQRVKGIQMPGKGQNSSSRMIGDVEVQHKGFIGKNVERVKSLFGKGQLMEGAGMFDPTKLDDWIKQQTVMPMPERGS
jgi:hypothetical protein